MLQREILNETILADITHNAYTGLPSRDTEVWLHDGGSWYQGIYTGKQMPGLVQLTSLHGETLYLSDKLILDAGLMRLNIQLYQRVAVLSRGDILDERVRDMFLSQGYVVKSLTDVRILVLHGSIYTATSLLILLTDFENSPIFFSETIRKHIIATEIGFFSNDKYTFDRSMRINAFAFMEQFRTKISDAVWDFGTFDKFIDFFILKLESGDYSPFANLTEFEKEFRGYMPKQRRFLNLAPLFTTGTFKLFDRYYTVLDKVYSVETGWVYNLDRGLDGTGGGWWVQEFMGAISSRHVDDVRMLSYKLIPEDKLYFNFSNDIDKPKVFYKFVDMYDEVWGLLTVSGQAGGLLTSSLVHYDNYSTTNSEDIYSFGYTRGEHAILGHTYRDIDDDSYWIVGEIYKNDSNQIVICVVCGSRVRRILDSEFAYVSMKNETPYRIGTKVACYTPGLEFDDGLVAATVTNQIGSYYNYCAVIRDGEGKWYPWSILDDVGFKIEAFHIPKYITGFVSYIELERPGTMYLEDIAEDKVDKIVKLAGDKLSELYDKYHPTPTVKEKLSSLDKVTRPAETAVVIKNNYMKNSIMYAGGATLLILAVNIYVAS